jgi:hypothetical protein
MGINALRDSDEFIYVPSSKLYFSKERKHQGKNWFEAHKALRANDERMPTIPEFIEFLRFAKINYPQIYHEFASRGKEYHSWSEWLDADFKIIEGKLHINYNHFFDSEGNLVTNDSEILFRNTLLKDKIHYLDYDKKLGIFLDDYLLKNYTEQGLPNKKVKSGHYTYYNPRNNNALVGSHAIIGASFLNCGGRTYDPSKGNSQMWVRAVRSE